jgi:hypothetical protein
MTLVMTTGEESGAIAIPEKVLSAICICGCAYANHKNPRKGEHSLWFTGQCRDHEDCKQFRMLLRKTPQTMMP